MKKILLITHGDLGKGYVSSLQIICGNDPIDTISLHENETLETMIQHVNHYVASCRADDLIIICTDIAVGTTTKSALPAMLEQNCFLLSGINLPLLLEITLHEFTQNPYEEIRTMMERAKDAIVLINDELQKEG